MEGFFIGNIYEENKIKAVDINLLPEKYCTFDCVFCPFGRTIIKTDKSFYFSQMKEFKKRFLRFIDKNKVDLVFINSNGEPFSNSGIGEIVEIIKEKNIKVKLLSNGYIFNNSEYWDCLQRCDEVIGELAVTSEEDFQKICRPIENYTLKKYVDNMSEFNKRFRGKFILDITILKNYSDSDKSIELFKDMVGKISPDELIIQTARSEILKGAFEISKEKLDKIIKDLR